jgi:antagonist of KipI
MIVVERAPPYLTIQDRGRFAYRASGVPTAGAMDQWSLAVANRLVGNDRNAAALEWAIGAGTLTFSDRCVIALTGSDIEATLAGKPVTTGSPIVVRAGESLAVTRLVDMRFVYIAISGGIQCEEVLGSRSTYLPASLGGLEGRRLKTGDRIATGRSGSAGENPLLPLEETAPVYSSEIVRVVPAHEKFEALARQSFRVSQATDRMGYRLETDFGSRIMGASITSEPVCPGAIQLPPDGQPIVLMADSPTVGGYEVIGTVISVDMPILAQCMPGRRVMFTACPAVAAQIELRRGERALMR